VGAFEAAATVAMLVVSAARESLTTIWVRKGSARERVCGGEE
jgi:hypothetical protein